MLSRPARIARRGPGRGTVESLLALCTLCSASGGESSRRAGFTHRIRGWSAGHFDPRPRPTRGSEGAAYSLGGGRVLANRRAKVNLVWLSSAIAGIRRAEEHTDIPMQHMKRKNSIITRIQNIALHGQLWAAHAFLRAT